MTEKTKFHFSRSDTADIMGITAIALGQWKVSWEIKKGNATFYDIRKVVQYRLARDEGGSQNTLTSQKTRLAKLQADKVENELRVARGELCPLKDIEEHWSNLVLALRAKLLSMPSRIAVSAIEATSIRDIEDVVTELLYEALEELKDDGIPKEVKAIGAGNNHADSSTTENVGERMGRQVQKTKPGSKRRTGAVAYKSS